MHTKRTSTNNKSYTQSCHGRQILAPRGQGKAIFQKIHFSHISEGDNKEVGLARKANQKSAWVYCSLPRSPSALWASRASLKRVARLVIAHFNTSRVPTRQREESTATVWRERKPIVDIQESPPVDPVSAPFRKEGEGKRQ